MRNIEDIMQELRSHPDCFVATVFQTGDEGCFDANSIDWVEVQRQCVKSGVQAIHDTAGSIQI